MESLWANNIDFIVTLLGFSVIVVAGGKIAQYFPNFNFPVITGFMFTGIICGPYILGLIPSTSIKSLGFINYFALSYIAFAAGSELYIRELRSSMKHIQWYSICLFVFTFGIGSISVFLLADYIPVVNQMNFISKICASMIAGIIFSTLSPTGSIAVINELRAKGPLTKTVMGVTVITDFAVIILFALSMSFAISMTGGHEFKVLNILVLFIELIISIGLGFALGKLLDYLLQWPIKIEYKAVMVAVIGYVVYVFRDTVQYLLISYFGFEFTLEALIICIIASQHVTNNSKNRIEFLSILHMSFPLIYAAFFTLTGASLSIYALVAAFSVSFLFFIIRMISIMTGSIVAGNVLGLPWSSARISWMPYMTQAGVAIGLAAMVAKVFPAWSEFTTFIIGIIVINEIVGPPLFKYALTKAGENHNKGTSSSDRIKKAIIFGFENQSVSLAKQLMDSGWQVQITTRKKEGSIEVPLGINIKHISVINLETLKSLDAEHSAAIVCLMSDQRNLETCELAYKHFGTRDLIVRLGERSYFEKFLKLGVRVVDPSTAIVSLLDNFVRSPQATSLLLGMEPGQDTRDLVLLDPSLHGMALRDIRLPSDVLILSIHRGGQMIISHGFTRLRLNDVVTFVGSEESLEEMSVKFENF